MSDKFDKNKGFSQSAKGREKLSESMSALMDNEASEFEFRRVLKESATDAVVKEKWQRYHTVSAILRGEFNTRSVQAAGATGTDLLSRIHAGLADEGVEEFTHSAGLSRTQNSQSGSAMSSFMRRLGQGAIAASVAAAVLIGGNVINSQTQPEQGQLELAGQTEPVSLPLFNDNYSPTQFSRVPRLNSQLTGVADTDALARDHLTQAVFLEFVGEQQESVELPVNFSVTREGDIQPGQ